MKIDVQTPKFCPDNCPNAELERLVSLPPLERKIWTCKNARVCGYIYERVKEEN